MKVSRIFPILIFTFCHLVASQDEPGALLIPSPHFSKGRSGQTAKYLIIHGTAGGSSVEGIGNWFQNPAAKASTHYGVDKKGKVAQYVLEKDTAWGNGRVEAGADPWWTGNPNSYTISIELVKSTKDNSNELTVAQKTAAFNLIKNILARNPGIKPQWADSTGGITGHYSISPKSREKCPGPFPWEEMFEAIGAGGSNNDASCVGTATTGLRIRSGPGTSFSVTGSLAKGESATFTERVAGENIKGNAGWLRTSAGYVSSYYIQPKSPSPSWCV